MADFESAEAIIDELWPSPQYFRYLERLKQAIGSPVFIAEINITAINLGVKLSDTPLTLLAIVDFPKPDPQKQLYPHLLIFEDGRGINLGHLARISLRAFNPAPDDLLYVNHPFNQEVLFAPRTLSRESIRATSTALLAEIFGDQPGRLLESVASAESLTTPEPSTQAVKSLSSKI
ncbi:MAG: hypothetical protein RLZZ215_1266 [Pseudomonadota bacterium]